MKKKSINEILIKQTKRRKTVFAFFCVIMIISLLVVSSFLIYFERSKKQYVTYDESSNIDYKVYLKNNEFFQGEYLGPNKEYIATLIDYISANFEYKLSLDEKDVEYKYSYRIEANVDVIGKKTNNSLYSTNEVLLSSKEKTTDLKNVIISENVNIDYNRYNEFMKKFINVYSLDDIDSTLTINMYINVVGSCDDFEENNQQESVMSLSIPLTTKTMAVDISNNLINTENNVMQCKSKYNNNFIFIIFGILFVITDIVLIIYTIRYEIKTRTAENIYERALKKILNNYGSYIQTLDNEFIFKNYQLLKINTFTDMLEIRDTIRQPILMKEKEDKTGAYFVIPSNAKILYVYRLKVSDIENKIKKL